eukprot:6010515-Prymnesium_polylepis.2
MERSAHSGRGPHCAAVCAGFSVHGSKRACPHSADAEGVDRGTYRGHEPRQGARAPVARRRFLYGGVPRTIGLSLYVAQQLCRVEERNTGRQTPGVASGMCRMIVISVMVKRGRVLYISGVNRSYSCNQTVPSCKYSPTTPWGWKEPVLSSGLANLAFRARAGGPYIRPLRVSPRVGRAL